MVERETWLFKTHICYTTIAMVPSEGLEPQARALGSNLDNYAANRRVEKRVFEK
jgi:hypothetical protein